MRLILRFRVVTEVIYCNCPLEFFLLPLCIKAAIMLLLHFILKKYAYVYVENT